MRPPSKEEKLTLKRMELWSSGGYFPDFVNDFRSGENCQVCMRGPLDNGTETPLFYCGECTARPIHGGVCTELYLLGMGSSSEKLTRRRKYKSCLGCVRVDAECDLDNNDAIKEASCGICMLTLSAEGTDNANTSAADDETKRIHQPSIVKCAGWPPHLPVQSSESGEPPAEGGKPAEAAGHSSIFAHTVCMLAARNPKSASPPSLLGGVPARAHSSSVDLDKKPLEKINLPECEHCAKKQNQDGSTSRTDGIDLPRRKGLLLCCSHPSCSRRMHPHCVVQDNTWAWYVKLKESVITEFLLKLQTSETLPDVLPDDSKKTMYLEVCCHSHKDLRDVGSMVGVVGANNHKTMNLAADLLYTYSDEDEEEGGEDDDSVAPLFGFEGESCAKSAAADIGKKRSQQLEIEEKAEKAEKNTTSAKSNSGGTAGIAPPQEIWDTEDNESVQNLNRSLKEQLERKQLAVEYMKKAKETYILTTKSSYPLRMSFKSTDLAVTYNDIKLVSGCASSTSSSVSLEKLLFIILIKTGVLGQTKHRQPLGRRRRRPLVSKRGTRRP